MDGPLPAGVQEIDSEEKMRLICEAADEMKARDIVILDVRGQTILADFFVLCSGTSITHIQSIADGVQQKVGEKTRSRGVPRAKPEGNAHSYWIILDFSDVIMHIFSEETREFYDLERLWSDAKVTHWESAPAEGSAAADAAAR